MKNQILLAALDLDGTCLTKDGIVTDRTWQALQKAGEKGVRIVMATGRPLTGVPEQLLGLPCVSHVIAQNGSRIYDVQGKETLYVQGLTKACLEKLPALIRAWTVLADFFADNRGYCEKSVYGRAPQFLANQSFCRYYQRTRVPVEGLWESSLLWEKPVEKVTLFFRSEEEKSKAAAPLHALPDTNICEGARLNFELNHASVNKGNALAFLAKRLGIPMAQTLSCGDSGNDVPMLCCAGIGVAMGNAAQEVKEAADYVTASHEADGVALALERFVL